MCLRCLFNAEESVHNAVLCPVPYIIADTGLRHSAIDSCQHNTTHTHTHTQSLVTHIGTVEQVFYRPLTASHAYYQNHGSAFTEWYRTADVGPNLLCTSTVNHRATRM